MARASAGVIAAAVMLSGCWVQVGFDAGHTRYNDLEDELTAANVATVTEAWSAEVGVTASEPIVDAGRVHIAAGGLDPDLRQSASAAAYAVSSGDRLWFRELAETCCIPGTVYYAPASLVGDELWTGFFVHFSAGGRPIGDFGAPTRLAADDGTLLQKGETDIAFVSAAVTSGENIVQVQARMAGDPERSLVVRDKASLTTKWIAALPGSVLDIMGRTAPAVADGQVFAADNHALHAFALAGCGTETCSPTWSLDLGAPATAVAAAPGGDTVLVLRGNDLVAVDRVSGAIGWTAPLGNPAAGLAIADDTIYVAAGTTLSTFPAGGCGATTCSPTTTAPLTATATASPTIAGGVVYVGETDVVEAFAVSTLDPLANVTVPGTTRHTVVDSGRLFVVSRAGTDPSRLTAFAPRTP